MEGLGLVPRRMTEKEHCTGTANGEREALRWARRTLAEELLRGLATGLELRFVEARVEAVEGE